MIKISPKEAESLLDEIDNLSSVMEDLDLDNAPKEVKPELLKQKSLLMKNLSKKMILK